MNTPICDFVRKYAQSNAVRLHMPGHKGCGVLGVEPWDITEIDGADVLYQANGIIKQSQENAASLFGTAKTVYSVEGSSLCIRAMLYLVRVLAKASGKRPLIAAGRNAHKVFMTAAALLDVDVAWLYPENRETLLSCTLTAQAIEQYLSKAQELPLAVYLTSPDYLGNMVDIAAIAEVCHRYGVLLLVDNAHGAYLRFLPESYHPITLGADLCCDSAHKTLAVLTGGAYLHVAKTAPQLLVEHAEIAMSVFASTSPSYVILQSLDAANARLAGEYPGQLAALAQRVFTLKKTLRQHGYGLVGNEPLKITVAPKMCGYTGTELAALLCEKGIVCEASDPDFVVLMLTTDSGTDELAHLETVLCSLPLREPVVAWAPSAPHTVQRLSPREALLSPSEALPIEQCVGRVLAAATVSCPPAIPVVVCGEEINEEAVRCFAYYGITECRVI